MPLEAYFLLEACSLPSHTEMGLCLASSIFLQRAAAYATALLCRTCCCCSTWQAGAVREHKHELSSSTFLAPGVCCAVLVLSRTDEKAVPVVCMLHTRVHF